MKAIKKRLNVREVKNDPEYATHDEGHEKYSRENLYLSVSLPFCSFELILTLEQVHHDEKGLKDG